MSADRTAEPPARPRGLVIVLWATDPDRPDLCAGPFMYAAAAAAMELAVEVHFTARAIRLLLPGVADGLYASAERTRSIAAFMRHAREHGAKFYACSAALAAAGLAPEQLIDEIDGVAGASTVASRLADPAWQAMVF
jgi:uncharacterized protein